MKKLYFTRHGLSEMNKLGLWASHTDTPLTQEGRDQAKQAGLAAKELQIDTIVSSPLSRAYETASIIAKQIGYPTDKIHTSSLLIERYFGEIEGTPYSPDLNLDGFADVEKSHEIIARAHEALLYLQSLPGDNILVVAHGSLGRALRHHLDPNRPFTHKSHFGNAEIIEFDPANFKP